MRFHIQIAAILVIDVLCLGHSLPDDYSLLHEGARIARSDRPRASLVGVTIVGDTNRDGRVDITGDSDLAGRETWNRDRGALFLANIADTDRRCSAQITASTPDVDLEKCHDASDDVLRNPSLLAPLRTLPLPDLSDGALGFVRVSNDTAAAAKVRIFHRDHADQWTFIGPNDALAAEMLREGLDLGIDARDVRRPDGWDGRAKVKFLVRDGTAEGWDEVALRVAPVLTHHHGQLAQMLLTQSSNMTGNGSVPLALGFPNKTRSFRHDPWQAVFVRSLSNISQASGIKSSLFLFNDPENQTDVWAQDYFEPGYTSIPGPEGPVGLRIMIRSVQPWRSAGRLPFSQQRSSGIGAIQLIIRGAKPGESTDSMGNLETIPPYTHNGTSYPAGRIIMGAQFGVEPRIVALLRAQEEQDPIILDNSWLYVGHVDEYLQFLPADNDHGWVLAVSDPLAGLDLLRAAQRDGHGGIPAFPHPLAPSSKINCVPTLTLDGALALANFKEIQESCARIIDKNVATIKQATGLLDEHVIRIPGIYYGDESHLFDQRCNWSPLNGSYWQPFGMNQTTPRISVAGGKAARQGSSEPGLESRQLLAPAFERLDRRQAGTPPHLRTLERRDKGKRSSTFPQVLAFWPGVINSVVADHRTIIAPLPWGPVVDGKDILEVASREAYARANFTVRFMDDWISHHLIGGEVHCGSNTLRDMHWPWW